MSSPFECHPATPEYQAAGSLPMSDRAGLGRLLGSSMAAQAGDASHAKDLNECPADRSGAAGGIGDNVDSMALHLLKRWSMAVCVVAVFTLVIALPAGATVTTTSTATSPSGSSTVWLCLPGQAQDPCNPGLSTTVYSPSLQQKRTQNPPPEKQPPIDCFYVYPTVSDQPTGNANLTIDPEERSIALYQAARYSQFCRVFAPMYQQVTLAGIGEGTPTTPPSSALAYSSLQAAFADYLSHYNDGRGFVLIGHSQGSFILRQLIEQDVDPVPSVRDRLVSAILLGGNVLVKPGPRGIGGDFQHIPACREASQTRCVIAFSTFDQPVPAGSLFGRTSGAQENGDVVLCTNPGRLEGGTGYVDMITPTAPFAPGTLIAAGISLLGLHPPVPTPPTVWYSLPGSYRAQCETSNGAHVLEITPVDGAQVPTPSPTPTWGLHLLDANIALGNLVGIVKAESDSFVRNHG